MKTIAIIDSGTSYILMPLEAHTILIEQLKTKFDLNFVPIPGQAG